MYDKNNVFAKIISGQIPAEKIYENESIIAIKDVNPSAPVHILVLPKGEYVDFADFTSNATIDEVGYYFAKVAEIARENTTGEYRLVTNKGTASGQSVFHFHTHILSGSKNKELLDKNI